MKYFVRENATGKVRFTAEIGCGSSSRCATKLRHAVIWAMGNNQSLAHCDFSGAVFVYADVSRCDFIRADLTDASFRNAVVTMSNFSDATVVNTDFTTHKVDTIGLL